VHRASLSRVQIYSPSGGAITSSLENTINTDATAFLGAAGKTTPGYTAMLNRLLANNASLASVTSIEAGVEIINTTGDLTLASNWDLSDFRYGPNSTAGDLTLRASGNLVFNFKASLSDGFGGPSIYGLWDAPLLPAGSTSWSYRLVAGDDFSGADYRDLQPLAGVAAGSGSLLLGKGSPRCPSTEAVRHPVPQSFQIITRRSARAMATSRFTRRGTCSCSIQSPRSTPPARRPRPSIILTHRSPAQ